MSLSTLYYMKNFASPTSGNDYLIKTAQAADGEEMARVYAKNVAEIVALNANIQDDDDKFTPVDAMLAGGGDGHTFIYTVTLSRTRLAAAQQILLGQQVIPVTPTGIAAFTGLPIPGSTTNNPTLGAAPQPTAIPPFWVPPELFLTRFGVASSQDEVQSMHNKLVDSIIAEIVAAAIPGVRTDGFYCPFQGIAGAAKGTRFMVSVTGVPLLAPGP